MKCLVPFQKCELCMCVCRAVTQTALLTVACAQKMESSWQSHEVSSIPIPGLRAPFRRSKWFFKVTQLLSGGTSVWAKVSVPPSLSCWSPSKVVQQAATGPQPHQPASSWGSWTWSLQPHLAPWHIFRSHVWAFQWLPFADISNRCA